LSAVRAFLLSGGSGGIGAALAIQLADRGYRPVIGYNRNAAAAEEVARKTGGMTLALDLASPASIETAVSQLAAQDAELAGVLLAGSPPPALHAYGKVPADEMARQWQVNVVGPQLLTAGLVRSCFRRAKKGTVIGVLTKAMGENGQGASSGMAAYVIAKYGLAGVLAALAAEFPWLKVRSVSPGYTETPMLTAFDPRFLELQREKVAFQSADQVALEIVREIAEE
jgi:NAD(P)-dependent dehydrogenase (short-subunit alcohol dehydrogenase family)